MYVGAWKLYPHVMQKVRFGQSCHERVTWDCPSCICNHNILQIVAL